MNNGKTILISGSTGFLGRQIIKSFKLKDLDFVTVGRSKSCDIRCDLIEEVPVIGKPFDTVIHCAGLAHYYPKSAEDEKRFYEGHVVVAQNLINALQGREVKKMVFISSVAVYGCDYGASINEELIPIPNTIYGRNKLEAEKIILDWGLKNGVDVYIFRLPLVVGDRAPGNLGKLVEAIMKKYYFFVKDINPKKSMILASDLADFLTDDKFSSPGIYNLTDGHHPSLREIETCIIKKYKVDFRPIGLPIFLIRIVGKIGDYLHFMPVDSNRLKKLTTDLTFDDQKARKNLNWNPQKVTDGWLST